LQIVRTLAWVVITAALVAFIAMNWHRAAVNIWPLTDTYLQFNWPVGVIALVFFLIGLAPMWLLHRAERWRWQRRFSSLENSVRAAAAAPPVATATQLEAASQEKPAI
jgi:putative membrane protein